MHDKKPLMYKASLLFVVCVCLALLYAGTLYAWADALLLIPHAETFTELYMDTPLKVSASSQKYVAVSFSFSIVNYEGKVLEYPYIVKVIKKDGTSVGIDSGVKVLEHGQFVTVSETFRLPKTYVGNTIEVVIFEKTSRERRLHGTLSLSR